MSTRANPNGLRPRAAEDVVGRSDGCDYCDDCGDTFAEDELTEFRGEQYCAKCLPSHADVCPQCERLVNLPFHTCLKK